MSADLWLLIVLVFLLVQVAAVLSAVEVALSSYSRARAEELATNGAVGAPALVRLLEDPWPRLNLVLLLRLLAEVSATVLTVVVVTSATALARWQALVVVIVVMWVVNFVLIGVGSRTLGRQHNDVLARWSAAPVIGATRVLGPLVRLLILIGNAITPGRGFPEGPFATEAELREMVDYAQASQLIEEDESRMIHSVFELGDTTVREVMVPRTDVVYIERHKTLRQAMSLFLRSGFSRVPVIGEDLDDLIGFAYLKDISKRVFDRHAAENTELVESTMRPVMHVPDSKPIDEVLREMQAQQRHIAVAVDEYGGTAGVLTIEDILEEIVGEITDEYDEHQVPVEQLPDGSIRVSSRFPVDDLDEVAGVAIDDEEVDSVGGLMAKHLGKVPLPGATVIVGGLVFTAEEATGRRRKIGTVRISPVPTDPDAAPEAHHVPSSRAH